MERIESFKVNHLVLEPGLYVSRRDRKEGVCVTTFDLRITAPNKEPVIDMPASSILVQPSSATALKKKISSILVLWAAERAVIFLFSAKKRRKMFIRS